MRISILNVHHPPFDKRVFHKVARSLVDAGHEVVSIVPSDEPVEDTGGVRFVTIPPAKSLPNRLVSVWRLIRAGMKEKADACLAVEPESWCAGLVIRLLTGRKLVFDVHEHAPSEFAKFFPASMAGPVEWLTLKVMRLFARFTHHIILTRTSFDEQFRGLATPRTVVINTNHLQPQCDDIPAALKERYASRPTLIHQGIFGDVRGSWQLLDAVKLVVKEKPDVKCILLGDYVYGSIDAYKTAIDEAGLADAIDLIPPVPFEKVSAYIAVSEIGLILFQPGPINHTLAMPHKMFDYMREGKPTIAPDFAVEVSAIMKDTDCGLLVDVTRPEAIADAILRLLNNPDEANRLGNNGREAVETRFNWQQEEKKLLEIFSP
jgi:glycosyltransferase involved in cell wall biosynthesis